MSNNNTPKGGMERRDFVKTGLFAGAVGLGGLVALPSLQGCSSIYPPSNTTSYSSSKAALTAGRWGLVVDVHKLNNVSNFQAIAASCHSHHNVPSIGNYKHAVKWIWEEDFEHSFEDMENAYLPEDIKELEFPVLCNHCDNPPCVRVCPTEATFKREDGIVMMDYHRCIGCRFCMTGCPYNARSLNFSDPRPYIDSINPEFPTREKGVVEKCTFCAERLDVGLAPYCVEASEGALIFGDLEDPKSEVRKVLDSGFSIRRRVELGTGPNVFYLLDESTSVDAQSGGSLTEEGSSHA